MLYESGSCNRTGLAGKTRLNYPTCLRYVQLLQLLHWVEFLPDNIAVRLTPDGLESGLAFVNGLRSARSPQAMEAEGLIQQGMRQRKAYRAQ